MSFKQGQQNALGPERHALIRKQRLLARDNCDIEREAAVLSLKRVDDRCFRNRRFGCPEFEPSYLTHEMLVVASCALLANAGRDTEDLFGAYMLVIGPAGSSGPQYTRAKSRPQMRPAFQLQP
jgi:hypothetical protein